MSRPSAGTAQGGEAFPTSESPQARDWSTGRTCLVTLVGVIVAVAVGIAAMLLLLWVVFSLGQFGS